MRLADAIRSLVTRAPARVVLVWLALAAGVGLLAPDLSKRAAEGQAHLIDASSESAITAGTVGRLWPDQAYESVAVVAFARPTGLSEADRSYVSEVARRYESQARPAEILRVLGPRSDARVAERLRSRDGTTELVIVPLSSSFVSPGTGEVVHWLQAEADAVGTGPPPGLDRKWTGDAVIGRDYMREVRTSLDRAALMTVVLLLGVLLVVYRSAWLTLVPLASIGLSLVIARGALAWLAGVGWEVSPLVELFLVALLFGSGTDFCLFVSWRFAENWNADDPAGAMRATLRLATGALLTSAGTVMIGLLLMGTTRFKLFSSTGPSVALGLAITVVATLTLTPSLLVLLARSRPGAFAGMTRRRGGAWEAFGRRAMSRPGWSWLAGLTLMVPLAVVGTRAGFLQDTLSEMPANSPSILDLKFIAETMGPGLTSPLTVVLESDTSLKDSEGLALIDEVSRVLARQRRMAEVRSATQPLGSTAALDPARLSSRLGQVNDGFDRIAGGASRLRDGLAEGLARLNAARWLERKTGITLTGPMAKSANPARDAALARTAFSTGLKQAATFLKTPGPSVLPKLDPVREQPTRPPETGPDPSATMAAKLSEAAEGAGQIADGARRAEHEVGSILRDPVGRRALDRLLVNAETIRDHPELAESFAAYISPDGLQARIDLSQATRIFSGEALDQVERIRDRLRVFLEEEQGRTVRASVTGANATAADSRALTRSDQIQTWIVVPIGVFLVLLAALRDPMACANLVVTMLLTYLFALGATHLAFVTLGGAEGIDWKVPYFLFVLLVAVGVDYNVFLMTRLHEESQTLGLRSGIVRAIGQTGGLISSAAAITAATFASFLTSPLSSLRQLGFALVVGIAADALVVRPLLVPCGHWLLGRRREAERITVLSPGRSRSSASPNLD